MLKIKMARISFESPGYTAIDITNFVANVAESTGLLEGIALVYTQERRCSVTMIEYEPELLADLEELLNKLNCIEKSLCDAIIGKSVVLPVHNGRLFLGTFKKVVFIDTSRVSGEKSVVIVLEGVFKDH